MTTGMAAIEEWIGLNMPVSPDGVFVPYNPVVQHQIQTKNGYTITWYDRNKTNKTQTDKMLHVFFRNPQGLTLHFTHSEWVAFTNAYIDLLLEIVR